jgi:hypothetical protein
VVKGEAGYGRIEVADVGKGYKDVVITLPLLFVQTANERYGLTLAENIPPGMVD